MSNSRISFDNNHVLQQLLNRFTYRPDWRFRLEHGCLLIDTIVIDSDNPSKKIAVTFSHGVPSILVHPSFSWEYWLRNCIRDAEMHELDEFFKIDGVKVFDPHR